MGVELPSDLRYESQVICVDGCIPDLVGFNRDGKRHVIVDGKFWAPLTNHQPRSYLQSLAEDEAGIVLFVAPNIRVPKLWAELRSICTESEPESLKPKTLETDHQGIYAGLYHERHTLAVVSWRYLLSTLQSALHAADEDAGVADVQQLLGLCEAMDADAFLPLTQEELEPSRGRRLLQLGTLVDTILNTAEEAALPWLSSPGQFSGDPGSFGRNFRMLDRYECWLGISGVMWGALRATPNSSSPLFIEFYGTRDQMRTLHQQLQSLERHEAERFQIFNTAEGGPSLAVALYLPVGVEEHLVVRAVIRQLTEIADVLGDSAVPRPIASGSQSQLLV